MARESKARYAILGILSAQASSGYDIKKAMQLSTNHFWSENDSSIYPALKQLYQDECVTCAEDNTSVKGKKIYSITKRGQKELELWLTKDPETIKSRNEFLLKIFFGWNVPIEVCLRHIRSVQIKCEQLAHFYDDLYQQKKKQTKTKQHLYQLLTLRSGILLNATALEWCNEAIKELTQWSKKHEK